MYFGKIEQFHKLVANGIDDNDASGDSASFFVGYMEAGMQNQGPVYESFHTDFRQGCGA